jgi:thymidylate synthase
MNDYRWGNYAQIQVLGALTHRAVGEDTAPPVNGNAMAAEIIGHACSIDPTESLVVAPARNLNYRHMIAEALWNLCPGMKIDIMKKFNKGIVRFVEDQPPETRAWARWHYGRSLFAELPRVVRELQTDPYSRRATATVVAPQTPGTPPCLLNMQFLMRNDKLHAITTMRSNDAWLGFPLDIYQFTLFQRIVAAAIHTSLGLYVHNVGSMHLYSRDYDVAKQAVLAVRPTPPDWSKQTPLDDQCIKQIESGELARELEAIAADEPRRMALNAGFGPLISILRGDYAEGDAQFVAVRDHGIGVGW